ncbi:lytic transglycosylase domain-containing protein [Robbsia sp. KACC 23696]|uniref:lytic transglycosylase domain-containing protein n=1 Tax=Robbsia sp. KACC 23696 TaxID=3149231 RepID=UPI00325A5ED1
MPKVFWVAPRAASALRLSPGLSRVISLTLSTPFALAALLSCATLAVPRFAQADCVLDAAKYHKVNPTILLGIAIVESRMRANATNVNTNGSTDMGMMQINSIHLPELQRYGVKASDLYDGCKNVYTGAWILRKQMDKYGNSWQAIGSYHSATPTFRDAYALRVRNTVQWLIKNGYAYASDMPKNARPIESAPMKRATTKTTTATADKPLG